MNRKYLVIGSNSFSGSDFIDLLLEDSQKQVIGVSRSPEKSASFLRYKRHKNPNFRFYQMDLNRDLPDLFGLIEAERPEYVVNFAALLEPGYSWTESWQWFQTNTVALAKIGEFLKDQSYVKRYLHISTPEVYGSCETSLTEDAPLNPSTPYAVSKAAGDMYLMTLFKAYGFPVLFIRSTNIYGAHQQLFRIMPRSVIYLKMGRTIELHGGGSAIKSFIHIRDVSQGELMVLEKGRTGCVYHFSPKEGGTAVRKVVEMICEKMGKDFQSCTRSVEERRGQDKAYLISSDRACRELGWDPKIRLTQGIDEVIDWVETEWPALQREPLVYQHRL